ncbi:chromate transport protein [Desulfosporosinus acididurans]|uniref:Chromate transport protein n=1 Tax=Desulfosporosinus acididurans TaxID=476652 RepID=A0A0J1IKF9_9FIRM|nr:chromate transporter [Desulfosporosinus acididurans]KLU65206.1 chromate transport protein [Desulfosporosinus acididurans]
MEVEKENEKRKITFKFLYEIFMVFFKISPITFGGGFAMIPIMEEEIVHKKQWIDRENLVDIFAVSQSLPGAIAVNSATFVGYQIGGIPGALAALVGIVIPTFVIIIILGALLSSFQQNSYVQAALQGIRPIVVALIASAAFKMGHVSVVDKISAAICAVCIMSLLLIKSLNLILVIFLGAFVGIVIVKVKDQQDKRLSHKKASGETL